MSDTRRSRYTSAGDELMPIDTVVGSDRDAWLSEAARGDMSVLDGGGRGPGAEYKVYEKGIEMKMVRTWEGVWVGPDEKDGGG